MNQRTHEAMTSTNVATDAAGTDAKHDVSVLNGLIAATFDSAEGYGDAAKEQETGQFGTMFADRATERSQVVTGLQDEVRRLSGEPEDSGSLLGGAHRMFTRIKSMATQRDDALVNEIENGEDHIKAKYEEAMADTRLMPTTRTAIADAYRSIKTGHDQMSQIKHAMTNKHGLPDVPAGV